MWPRRLTTSIVTIRSRERPVLSLDFSKLKFSHAKFAFWVDKANESTCVIEKTRSRVRWMFWASIFLGKEEGHNLFCEKERGFTTAGYYAWIALLIGSAVLRELGMLVTLDNASLHKADQTVSGLTERNISPIEWPPYFPNLNPIESV